MEEFNFDVNQSDKELLRDFIFWLQGFLREVIRREELFYRELFDPMNQSWVTVNSRFEALANEVENISDENLEAHGLTGAELRFKLSTIQLRSRIFMGKIKGFILKGLLGSSDTLLNSILSAIPYGTAVSEFKDAVIDSIQESNTDKV